MVEGITQPYSPAAHEPPAFVPVGTLEDYIRRLIDDIDAVRPGGTIRIFETEGDPGVYNNPRVGEAFQRAKRPYQMLLLHYNRGTKLLFKDKVDEAVSDYEYCEMLTKKHGFKPKVVEGQPNRKKRLLQRFFGDLFNNYGYALMQAGRLEEALPRLNLALQFNPRQRFANNNIGDCLKSLGYPEEAKAYYRKELAINLKHPTAQTNLV